MKIKIILSAVFAIFTINTFSQIDPVVEYIRGYEHYGTEYTRIVFSRQEQSQMKVLIDTTGHAYDGQLYAYNDSISLVILDHDIYASNIMTVLNDSILFKDYIYVKNDRGAVFAVLNKKKNEIYLFGFLTQICAECIQTESGFNCVAYERFDQERKVFVESLSIAIGFIETYLCW